MARTTLSRSIYDPALIKKVIQHRLVDLGWNEHDLADKTGLTVRNITDKYKSGYWTAEELFMVFTATKMPGQSIVGAMKGA